MVINRKAPVREIRRGEPIVGDVDDETFRSLDGNRPTREQIVEMRRYMLLYLKQLLIRSSGTQEEELQAILNYLHTVHEVRSIVLPAEERSFHPLSTRMRISSMC